MGSNTVDDGAPASDRSAPSTPRWRLAVGLVSLLIVGAVVSTTLFDDQLTREAVAWLRALGPVGQLLLVGLFGVCAVTNLPPILLIGAAVAVYGHTAGFIIALIGSLLAINVSFGLGRYTR